MLTRSPKHLDVDGDLFSNVQKEKYRSVELVQRYQKTPEAQTS